MSILAFSGDYLLFLSIAFQVRIGGPWSSARGTPMSILAFSDNYLMSRACHI
jgi:hypothetical protein